MSLVQNMIITTARKLARLSAWFATEKGQTIVYRLAVAGGIYISVINVLPYTLCINECKNLLTHTHNEDGEPDTLSQPAIDRFNKALDILQVPDTEKLCIEPFVTDGFDVYSVGTVLCKLKAIIGIPYYFQLIDDREKHENDEVIKELRKDPVQGELLYQCMFISENTQIYLMAKEIEMSRTPKFIIQQLLPISAYTLAYGIGHNVNIKFNLRNKPPSIRVIIYVLIGGFMYVSYRLINKKVQLYYENKIDIKLQRHENGIIKKGCEEIWSRNIALLYARLL